MLIGSEISKAAEEVAHCEIEQNHVDLAVFVFAGVLVKRTSKLQVIKSMTQPMARKVLSQQN